MTALLNQKNFAVNENKKENKKEREKIILKTIYYKEEILDIIDNLLTNGIELSIAYWACMPDSGEKLPIETKHYYIKKVVTIAEKEANTDDGIKSVKLTEDKLLEGLSIMKQDYPKHFNDAISGNDDGDTADVFIQCCVLKKVVYG